MQSIDNTSLGKNIKKLRQENQLSQADFSKKLNVSPQAVSKWENGKNLPDMLTLKLITTLFHLSIDALLSDDDTLHEKEEVNEESFTKKYIFLLVFYSFNVCFLLIIIDFFCYEHSVAQYIILALLYSNPIMLYFLLEFKYFKKKERGSL